MTNKEEQLKAPQRFSLVQADDMYIRYRERYATSSYTYKYLLTVMLENLDSVIDVGAMETSLDGFAEKYCTPLPEAKKSNVS